jgi:hypothetical protein
MDRSARGEAPHWQFQDRSMYVAQRPCWRPGRRDVDREWWRPAKRGPQQHGPAKEAPRGLYPDTWTHKAPQTVCNLRCGCSAVRHTCTSVSHIAIRGEKRKLERCYAALTPSLRTQYPKLYVRSSVLERRTTTATMGEFKSSIMGSHAA